jgi:glucosamine--fructose-6-phosphate aminotransferase (isomerizing)
VLDRPLVQATLAAGAGRDALTYHTLKVLADLDPAVAAVAGYTRYRIDGDPEGDAQISIVDRGGLSVGVPSRVERNPQLVGTKRRVAAERQVLVARVAVTTGPSSWSRRSRRACASGSRCCMCNFMTACPPPSCAVSCRGTTVATDRLVDWVTETEGVFRDDLLGEFSVADLLIAPISDAADQWRS